MNNYCEWCQGRFPWDKDKNQWIGKEDVGTESYTEQEKGQASDAFKRACFNWGIGRELYTAPFIWIPSSKANIKPDERYQNKFICNDKFFVDDIEIKDKVITKLAIKKDKDIVYEYGTEERKIDELDASILENTLKQLLSEKQIITLLAQYGVTQAKDLTVSQHGEILHRVNKKGA